LKRLWLPAILGSAGAILLALLFPRLDPSAKFVTSMDRTGAIARARELSSQFGVETSGWSATASEQQDAKIRRYLSLYPDEAVGRLFTAVSWSVLLENGPRVIQVQLFADGRPESWEIRRGAAGPRVTDLLRAFAGDRADCFVESGRRPQKGGELIEWHCSGAALAARLEVTANADHLVYAKLSPVHNSSSAVPEASTARQIGTVLGGLASTGGFLLAIALALRASVRRDLPWRFLAVVATAAAAWILLAILGGPEYPAASIAWYAAAPVLGTADAQAGAEIGVRITAVVGFVAPVVFPFLSVFAFGGAGYALAQRGIGTRLRSKWHSLEGRTQMGVPIAAGILCGLALAGARYAVAALWTSASLVFHDRYGLDAPFPPLGQIHLFAAIPAFSYLGFWWTLAARIRAKWARWIVAAALTLTFIVSANDAFSTRGPSLVLTAIAAAMYLWLYARFDILAVAIALLTIPAVLVPSVMVVQPPPGVNAWGVGLFVALGIALAGSVLVSLRLADDAAPILPEIPNDLAGAQSLSNRKRLEAEFAVARKAQQDALPSRAPAVDGYSFSASCDPALHVGGDLYDIFPLPDGRLGIAVADVSGKGVPAALYMMVTKGLLTATSQQSSDLTHIFDEINQHLYRVCKRKMFVTMAAVAIDPAQRRMQYARAGHNPIVWRRVKRGLTELRKPGGLGLGMCAGDRFARALRVEELQLDPGDAIVLYSDGVTEAMNGALEQFGEARLMQSIERSDGQPAAATRAALLRDLAEFTAGSPPHDDVTIVVVRVTEQN